MREFKLWGMKADPLLPSPKVRTGQTPTKLAKKEYLKRWRERFYDPVFASENGDPDTIAEIAGAAYEDERKSPRTRRAGLGFADPEYELSVERLEARQAIGCANTGDRADHCQRSVL